MDARAFVQWTFRAGVALLAIVAGFYLSPWLGGASLPLAVLFWLAILIGVLYTAEALPWIDRIESISRLLRVYAPPLPDDEKERLRQRAEQQEQDLLWQDAKQAQDVAEAQRQRQFFKKLPYKDFNTSASAEPKPLQAPQDLDKPPQRHPSSGAQDDTQHLSPTEELDQLIGLASVKKKITEYKNLILSYKAKGLDMHARLEPFFVLVGNPGTGKTTVARIMARIFHEIGYLPTDRLVEASREDLLGQYQSDTERNTLNALNRALGGTFFIDEVYTLAPPGRKDFTDIGTHVIDTLVRFMDNNKGQLVIVVAGYEDKMDRFLDANAGLRSRFSNKIVFPDYTPDESKRIFLPMLAFHGLELTPEAAAALTDILDIASNLPQPGNARDLRKLATYVASHQSVRSGDPKARDVTDEDLRAALDDLKQMKTLAPSD